MKLSLNCVCIHCVWEALNSSASLSLSLSLCCYCTYLWMCSTFILNTDTNLCDKELKMYESAFFLLFKNKNKNPHAHDRHKHLQDTYIDIGACVCVCVYACIHVWVWVCVCVRSCCMHWILTICISCKECVSASGLCWLGTLSIHYYYIEPLTHLKNLPDKR